MRPLVVLDCETTGVNPETDRIVEIALAKVMPDGQVDEQTRILNPEIPIPAEAIAIHGITDADVENATTFRTVAKGLAGYLEDCDLAGFGIARFDIRLLKAEFARAGVPFSTDGRAIIDAMELFHKKEPRDLTAAVQFYVCEKYKGHRAHVDVGAAVAVLATQLDRYPDLPREVAGLHALCVRREPHWLDEAGRVIWKDGAARLGFGKHAGKTLEELIRDHRDYVQWALGKDFPADTRALLADALAGRFPAAPKGCA